MAPMPHLNCAFKSNPTIHLVRWPCVCSICEMSGALAHERAAFVVAESLWRVLRAEPVVLVQRRR
jgi:hypothetical protein